MNYPYVSSTQVASSVPFDSTQDAFNSTDVQAALGEIRQHPVWDQDAAATTLNGTLTLTTLSKGFQLLTGSATGFTVIMPNALTTFVGQEYMLINQSSQPMTIKDGGGNILLTLAQTSIGFLMLQAQGSSAGTWVYWQTFIGVSSGVVNYNVISSTTFSSSANADTIIPGMTLNPQAGTYAIWYSSQNNGSGAGQQLNCTLYKGGTAIPDSFRSAASTANGHSFFEGTQTIAQFDGATACAVYVNANANSMTINQRSLLMIRLGT